MAARLDVTVELAPQCCPTASGDGHGQRLSASCFSQETGGFAGFPRAYVWDATGALVAYSNQTDLSPDAVMLAANETGFYQIEVYGYRDGCYGMALHVDPVMTAAAPSTSNDKVLPTAPVVASASAPPEQQALPDAPSTPDPGVWRFYLPAIMQ